MVYSLDEKADLAKKLLALSRNALQPMKSLQNYATKHGDLHGRCYDGLESPFWQVWILGKSDQDYGTGSGIGSAILDWAKKTLALQDLVHRNLSYLRGDRPYKDMNVVHILQNYATEHNEAQAFPHGTERGEVARRKMDLLEKEMIFREEALNGAKQQGYTTCSVRKS